LLAHGRWFSAGTPASSTTKTGRHDIAEILLKVGLNTKNQSNQSFVITMMRSPKHIIGLEERGSKYHDKSNKWICQSFKYDK
jgi:hypothetical protein